jgi:hypothetical protein
MQHAAEDILTRVGKKLIFFGYVDLNKKIDNFLELNLNVYFQLGRYFKHGIDFEDFSTYRK